MTYNGLKASKYTKTYQIGFSPINCTWKTPFSSSKIKFEKSICYLQDQIVSNPALPFIELLKGKGLQYFWYLVLFDPPAPSAFLTNLTFEAPEILKVRRNLARIVTIGLPFEILLCNLVPLNELEGGKRFEINDFAVLNKKRGESCKLGKLDLRELTD